MPHTYILTYINIDTLFHLLYVGNIDIVLYSTTDKIANPPPTDNAACLALATGSKWWTMVEKGTVVRVCSLCKCLFQNTKHIVKDDEAEDDDDPPPLTGCAKYDLVHVVTSPLYLPIHFDVKQAMRRKNAKAQRMDAESTANKTMTVSGLTESLLQAYDAYHKYIQGPDNEDSEDSEDDGLCSSDDDDEEVVARGGERQREIIAERARWRQRLAAGDIVSAVDKAAAAAAGVEKKGVGWRLLPGQLFAETPKQEAETTNLGGDKNVLILRVFSSSKQHNRRGKSQPPMFTVVLRLTPTMTMDIALFRVKRAYENEVATGNIPYFHSRDFILRHPVSMQQFIAVTKTELKERREDQQLQMAAGRLGGGTGIGQGLGSSSAGTTSSIGSSRGAGTFSSYRKQRRKQLVPNTDEYGPGEALVHWADKKGRVDAILYVNPPPGYGPAPSSTPGGKGVNVVNTKVAPAAIPVENTSYTCKPGYELHAFRDEVGAAAHCCWRCGGRFCLRDVAKQQGNYLCGYHKDPPVHSKGKITFPCCKKTFASPEGSTALRFLGEGIGGPQGEPLGYKGPEPCVRVPHYGELMFPLRYMANPFEV